MRNKNNQAYKQMILIMLMVLSVIGFVFSNNPVVAQEFDYITCLHKQAPDNCDVTNVEKYILGNDILAAMAELESFPEGRIKNYYLATIYSLEFLEKTYNPIKARKLFIDIDDTYCNAFIETDCGLYKAYAGIAHAGLLICNQTNPAFHSDNERINPVPYLESSYMTILNNRIIYERLRNEGPAAFTNKIPPSDSEIDDFLEKSRALQIKVRVGSALVLRNRITLASLSTEQTKTLLPLWGCLLDVSKTHEQDAAQFKKENPAKNYILEEFIAFLAIYQVFGVDIEERRSSIEQEIEIIDKVTAKIKKEHIPFQMDMTDRKLYCEMKIPFEYYDRITNSILFKNCLQPDIYPHSGE